MGRFETKAFALPSKQTALPEAPLTGPMVQTILAATCTWPVTHKTIIKVHANQEPTDSYDCWAEKHRYEPRTKGRGACGFADSSAQSP